MTKKKQAKSQVAPAKDLGTLFRNLEKADQDAAIHYFNLHNAAIWLYQQVSGPAREYINTAISYSVEYKENQQKELNENAPA